MAIIYNCKQLVLDLYLNLNIESDNITIDLCSKFKKFPIILDNELIQIINAKFKSNDILNITNFKDRVLKDNSNNYYYLLDTIKLTKKDFQNIIDSQQVLCTLGFYGYGSDPKQNDYYSFTPLKNVTKIMIENKLNHFYNAMHKTFGEGVKQLVNFYINDIKQLDDLSTINMFVSTSNNDNTLDDSLFCNKEFIRSITLIQHKKMFDNIIIECENVIDTNKSLQLPVTLKYINYYNQSLQNTYKVKLSTLCGKFDKDEIIINKDKKVTVNLNVTNEDKNFKNTIISAGTENGIEFFGTKTSKMISIV